MTFNELIENLNPADKENFNFYSTVRGVQQYRIIFETLSKIDSNITYKDVNSFIRYDKGIKDVLFKYLGTLEEYIKNDILINYDFAPDAILRRNEYHYFDKLPKCIKKSQSKEEVTEFYKRFALNFGDIVSFIKEYMPNKYDSKKLDEIVNLRNDVMHHSPLLFNCNFESTKNVAVNRIKYLINMLPLKYPKYIADEINERTERTKNNIKEEFYALLLEKF